MLLECFLNVTVCQLPEKQTLLPSAMAALELHLRETHSDLLLLPELPFDQWLPRSQNSSLARWQEAALRHDKTLEEFQPSQEVLIAGTRPVCADGQAYNQAFYRDCETGLHPCHKKYYLPEEDGFWEASWYQRGPKSFEAIATLKGVLGFLICSEIWFTEWARAYARQGTQLLLCPRATESASSQKWLAGGQAAAIMAGAFCLSSNRCGVDGDGRHWAGAGWVISPDGDVLAVTDAATPFQTVSIDLTLADQAKKTYPRYIQE